MPPPPTGCALLPVHPTLSPSPTPTLSGRGCPGPTQSPPPPRLHQQKGARVRLPLDVDDCAHQLAPVQVGVRVGADLGVANGVGQSGSPIGVAHVCGPCGWCACLQKWSAAGTLAPKYAKPRRGGERRRSSGAARRAEPHERTSWRSRLVRPGRIIAASRTGIILLLAGTSTRSLQSMAFVRGGQGRLTLQGAGIVCGCSGIMGSRPNGSHPRLTASAAGKRDVRGWNLRGAGVCGSARGSARALT